uniref:Uncharacterized protein n=1 Tax=Arundo donax TaxID=35708 RepID=A0A0A9C605_ARUDO
MWYTVSNEIPMFCSKTN